MANTNAEQIALEVWREYAELDEDEYENGESDDAGDYAVEFANSFDGDLNVVTDMMERAANIARENIKTQLRIAAEANALGQYLSNADDFTSIEELTGLSDEDWNDRVAVWQPFEDEERSEVETLIRDYHSLALQNIEEL